ncbi:anion permease [Petrachloros mirabilis]
MELSFLLFLLVFILAYANGTNDVSKSIATLVGSGVTHYRAAIIWGTMWTVAGAAAAAMISGEMVRTFSQGLLQTEAGIDPSFAVAVLLGAMGWVFYASRTGLPVSTTHALTGAIIGTGLVGVSGEVVVWPAIGHKIVLPLMASPFLAFALSLLLHPVMRVTAARWEGSCLCLMPGPRALVSIDAQGETRTLFQTTSFGSPVVAVPSQCDRAGIQGWIVGLDTVHWISSGLTSFARGANDAPKIVAMVLLGMVTATWPSTSSKWAAFGGVALAMGLGSYIGGRRVTEVLAEKVTRMDHTEGLSANLATSTLVLTSGWLGLPVSTTHVSSSAIIGIGLRKGPRALEWTTIRDMVLAWIVTLPVSALLSISTYLFLEKFL